MRSFVSVAALLSLSALNGCMFHKVDYNAKSATAVDPKMAQNDYWFAKPAVASARSNDFDALWNAVFDAAREHSFTIDRRNYREGLLTTTPLVSKQPFELWKHDVVSPEGQLQATLCTMRRTIRFQIRKRDDGGYVCEPKVVIERYAMPERRITSVVQYQEAFSTLHGSAAVTSEEGDPLRVAYWYADGRDEALERDLAESIQQRVNSMVRTD
jgi:hypothetical protein